MDENNSTSGSSDSRQPAQEYTPREQLSDIMHALARLKHVIGYTDSQIKGLRKDVEKGVMTRFDYQRRHKREKLLASMEAAWTLLMEEQVMLEDMLVDLIGKDFPDYIQGFYKKDFGLKPNESLEDFDDDLPKGTIRLGSKANPFPPKIPPQLLDDEPPF